MKYTLKQVMAFCAMTYETEINRVNGRTGYLIAPDGQQVGKIKQKKIAYAPAGMVCTVGLYLIGMNSIHLINNGYHTGNVLAIVTAIAMTCFSVVLFRRDRKLFASFKQAMEEYALGHEPAALWDFEYSQGSDEKGNLIRSLLGARMCVRKMISSTAIPMDNDVVDARITYLIKEITNSKTGEIHEVILEEAQFFCRQAVTQMNFYAPLINFQDAVEKEFLDKNQS
jgi:hypothetical protein